MVPLIKMTTKQQKEKCVACGLLPQSFVLLSKVNNFIDSVNVYCEPCVTKLFKKFSHGCGSCGHFHSVCRNCGDMTNNCLSCAILRGPSNKTKKRIFFEYYQSKIKNFPCVYDNDDCDNFDFQYCWPCL